MTKRALLVAAKEMRMTAEAERILGQARSAAEAFNRPVADMKASMRILLEAAGLPRERCRRYRNRPWQQRLQAAGLRAVVLNSLQIVGTPEHFRHTSDKFLRLRCRSGIARNVSYLCGCWSWCASLLRMS